MRQDINENQSRLDEPQRREDHWAITKSQRLEGSEDKGLKSGARPDSAGDPDGETVTNAPEKVIGN
jgi:hypothetical protein